MLKRLSALLTLSKRELLVLVLVFAATLPAVTTRIYSSDEIQYFSYLRSLWFDGDVSFENEYRYFAERGIAQTPDFRETFLVRETPAGRRINFGTIGSAILWSPFYAAADAGVRIARAAGSAVPADGFSKPYVAAVAYGSAFYGFAAILLGIAAARRVLGPVSIIPAVAVWIGTPLLFYMYVAPPFSHACSAFAVALFITVWLRVRVRWTPGGVATLGLAGALVAMVREQDVFFLLGPAVDFAITAIKGPRAELGRRAAAAGAGCLAFAIGLVPQLAAYSALNGHPGPSTYVTRKMYWHSPHALQVMFDPHHGLFIWTPLALLAVAGLVLLAGRAVRPGDRRIAGCALLMVAAQVYVSGAVDSWSVAGAFGHRRFVALTALLVVGLSTLWRAAGAIPVGNVRILRPALGVAVAVCVWWNVALIALFATRMMDRQRVEIRRNARDAFVTLPAMAPDLAWRYFTARESFFDSRAGRP